MVKFSPQIGLGLFILLERHWCYFSVYMPVNDDGTPFNVVNNDGTPINLGTPDSVDTPDNDNMTSNS